MCSSVQFSSAQGGDFFFFGGGDALMCLWPWTAPESRNSFVFPSIALGPPVSSFCVTIPGRELKSLELGILPLSMEANNFYTLSMNLSNPLLKPSDWKVLPHLGIAECINNLPNYLWCSLLSCKVLRGLLTL